MLAASSSAIGLRYTSWVKKEHDTLFWPLTSANIDRFWKLFHHSITIGLRSRDCVPHPSSLPWPVAYPTTCRPTIVQAVIRRDQYSSPHCHPAFTIHSVVVTGHSFTHKLSRVSKLTWEVDDRDVRSMRDQFNPIFFLLEHACFQWHLFTVSYS